MTESSRATKWTCSGSVVPAAGLAARFIFHTLSVLNPGRSLRSQAGNLDRVPGTLSEAGEAAFGPPAADEWKGPPAELQHGVSPERQTILCTRTHRVHTPQAIVCLFLFGAL